MKLNLGSCDRAFPDFLSVDICPPADIIADLSKPWPWPDAGVDEVRAHDVFEHIGDCDHITTRCERCKEPLACPMPLRATSGRIHVMNELHRVLKPGARATVEVPSAAHGGGFACDPTHVSPWCLSSFAYFEQGAGAHTRFAKPYGITAAFRVVALSESPDPSHREPVWKVTAILECVK
jgi:hypothetical protein